MSKKVDFRHEERSIILAYLTAKAEATKAAAAEKVAKTKAKELLVSLSKLYKATDKTSYLYGTLQVSGKEKAVVYKETIAKGAINWEAYAKALGGTDEGAEAYRKPNNVRTSLDWATEAQELEIAQR